LLQEPAAARANRQSNRYFMSSRERSDQQQIPNVRARNQQHEKHYDQRDFECGQQSARVVEWRLP
jgi:hypothetical protein